MDNMKLSELKAKSPARLLVFAEQYEVENASTMRKQS
jgi:transcription termination factor Rho